MNKLLATAAFTLLLASPSLGQEEASLDTVLATVNGTDITIDHLVAMRSMLPPEYQAVPDEILFDGMLEQLIEQQLLADAVSESLTDRDERALENERRAFLAAIFLERLSEAEVSEADLQAEYDANYAEAPLEYNASHILVETEEAANDLVTQLSEGADFATLAEEHSIGPSGPNGGALNWFTQGMMVPSFEAAVVALEVGEVSDPVETQFGWHVILLNETRDAPVPSFDEMRPQLTAAINRSRIEERLEELRAEAEIEREEVEVDASVIRSDDPVE